MSRALSITELADMLARGVEGWQSGAIGVADAPPPLPVNDEIDGAEDDDDGAAPMPRHFAPDPGIARALGVSPQLSDEDPIRQAWKSGFEDGVATEKRLMREMRGEDSEALAQLAEHMRRIAAADVQMLESRMREAVVALCRQVIDDCTVPPERLAARIETAVRMLAAAHNEKTIEVNPVDAELLRGLLPAEWVLAPNAEIARGGIRVTTRDGGVEDGPEHWKLALEEAIRTC